ncbi:MAG: T9SS type A sorting domain-containing protein, partial [Bacteroidota bacterium]|nr:T9SS type A sorting domain-containing protein [Bacteroidota bacterium]
ADECKYMFFPPAAKSAMSISDAPGIIATENGNITVQVVPNPFKAFTEVQVMSPVNSSTARVDIYDVSGRLITSYVGDGLEAGVTKSFMILDSDLAANQSIFICIVRTDQGSVVKRIIRLF